MFDYEVRFVKYKTKPDMNYFESVPAVLKTEEEKKNYKKR